MEENNNTLEEIAEVKEKFFLFERKHQLITLFGLVILLAGFITIVNQIKYAQQFSSNAQTPVTYTSTPTSTPAPTSATGATSTPTPAQNSTASATIKVIYPNGGETLYKGKTYTIKWSFSTNQVNITYPIATSIVIQSANLNTRRNVYTVLNKPYTKPGTNTFTFTVPTGIATASNYRVNIQINKLFRTSTGGYTYPKDESDKNFKITNAVIAGYVFLDTNKNGKWDTKLGEKAYTKGAVISLSGGIFSKKTTLKNGTYEFSNLLPKNYTVKITVPNGYKATTPQSIHKTLPPDGRFDFGIVSK